MKLRIDEEHEWYLIDRLRREIRGGELLHMERDTFLFSIETFDANEMLSWVKSFIGRILSLECTNPYVSEKFHRDIERMYTLYCGEEI